MEATGLIKYDQARQALMEANTVDEVKISELDRLPEISGIYLVYNADTCIYIGQSKNIKRRWRSHHRLKQINSMYPESYIVWIRAKVYELDALERDFIKNIDPLLNRKRIIREVFFRPNPGKPIQEKTKRTRYIPDNIFTGNVFLDFFSFGTTNEL